LTTKESTTIVKNKEGLIKIDGKVRRNPRYPLGSMDVITIEKTNEHFRMLLDTRGRFLPHRIDAKEANFKLCKVLTKKIGQQKVPYITTHDGRTIRFPHPDIQINDSIKLNLTTGEIGTVVKFQNGASVLVCGGNNIGRIGTLTSVERHQGSFDIAHVRDTLGHVFATRLGNIFIIGDGKVPAISIPKGEGIKYTLIEERDRRMGDESDVAAGDETE